MAGLRRRGRFNAVAMAMAFCLYTVIGGYGASFRFPEVFPFFNWALFSFPPRLYDEWTVRVLELNGQPLQPPRMFGQVPALQAGVDTGTRKQVREWGKRVQAGDAEGAARQRALFENLFIGQQQVRYQLVVEHADPIERWRDGSVQATEVLGEFEWQAGDAQ